MPSPSHLRKLLGPALVTLLIAAVLAVGTPAGATGDKVFVWHSGSFTATAAAGVRDALTLQGHDATAGSALPSDLGPYDVVWHVRIADHTDAESGRLAAHVGAGGGLFLSGDCCQARLQALVRQLTGDDGVTLGSTALGAPFTFNPGAAADATTTPNTLTGWSASAARAVSGVAGGNVLATHGSGAAVGALWTEGDLPGVTGRLAVLMDWGWQFSLNTSDVAVIANLHAFLTGSGEVAENTPPEVHITEPVDGHVMLAGETLTVVATVVDPDPDDSHTCTMAWGDGSTTTVGAEDGTCTAARVYEESGNFTVTVTATDAAEESGSDEASVVVVDTGVSITGGGSLEGRAAPFNISVRYRPRDAAPAGQVRFRTEQGEFRSLALNWVVAGSDGGFAVLSGTGAIDGGPAAPFRLVVVGGGPGLASLQLTWTGADGPGAFVGPLGVRGGSIQVQRSGA